ncbi:MAG: HEPN domain-containing protein [Candidatus Margulisbacteria bacterium]|nr:HEPN domain-containing protein [Candidatus Margulisiibacteriota bacterium]
MKTSFEHLPEEKQQDLKQAVDIIREEVNPELLILFGSYARGDWVEDLDPDTLHYRYQSDMDLLVVTETRKEADNILKNRLLSQSLMRRIPRTPISLIADDIELVNGHLRKSHYFFIDIKREGIVLYDSGKLTLAEPKDLSPKDRKHLATEDFDYWFKNASGFMKGFHFYMQEKENNKAAFLLHQVVESLYSTVLLVFTRYKPNTHDLEKLIKHVTRVEPEFLEVFPQGTEEERERFKLLREAYVKARYKPSYTVTQEELKWLAERVVYLQQLTETLCKKRLESYGE